MLDRLDSPVWIQRYSKCKSSHSFFAAQPTSSIPAGHAGRALLCFLVLKQSENMWCASLCSCYSFLCGMWMVWNGTSAMSALYVYVDILCVNACVHPYMFAWECLCGCIYVPPVCPSPIYLPSCRQAYQYVSCSCLAASLSIRPLVCINGCMQPCCVCVCVCVRVSGRM